MIDLLTGLPGNAKTLFGLERWIQRASLENRPVYYSGLKEFKDDDPRLKGTQWIELDPVRWHLDVPPGSLVFIDEGQKIFRNRSLGAQPPLHVTELEEHRHKGLDFLIITQHPSLIDPAIRRLTQTHLHMVRIFGMEASTVHKWNGTKDNCDKSRSDSEKTKWAFNKSLYGLYKSADVHTMKRTIPFRVKMLLSIPFLLVGLGYSAYTILKRPNSLPSPVISTSSHIAPGAIDSAAAPLGVARFDPIVSAQDFQNRSIPRISGLEHTAPKYDELTKPVRVPVPAACIIVGSDCRCLSQQGTPLNVQLSMCIQFVEKGWFQEFDSDPKLADNQPRSDSSHGLPSTPSPSSPQVVAFDSVSASPKPSAPKSSPKA